MPLYGDGRFFRRHRSRPVAPKVATAAVDEIQKLLDEFLEIIRSSLCSEVDVQGAHLHLFSGTLYQLIVLALLVLDILLFHY